MGGQQNCAALPIELGNELPQGLTQLYIHTGSGFVQHNHRGFVHECLCHQHPALHATGKLAHIGLSFIGQAQALQ